MIIEKYKLDLPEIISYIPQKEIRQPINKDNIIRNWSVVETQRVTEMGQIFYSQKVDDEVIKDLIDNLPFTKITSLIKTKE